MISGNKEVLYYPYMQSRTIMEISVRANCNIVRMLNGVLPGLRPEHPLLPTPAEALLAQQNQFLFPENQIKTQNAWQIEENSRI